MFPGLIKLSSSKVCLNALRFCSAIEVGSTEYFKTLVGKAPVVVFMKGTPEEPRCGFSNAVVQVMRMHGCTYDAHNVLSDDRVRNGIKEFSNWPTIPQVYMGGEFIGGCDILIQMHQNGELIEELSKVGITSNLLDEVKDK